MCLDAHLDAKRPSKAYECHIDSNTTAQELRMLEKRHILQAEGYGCGDFLYYAIKLGMFKRIVWVSQLDLSFPRLERRPRAVKHQLEYLRCIQTEKDSSAIQVLGNRIRFSLYGTPVDVVPLDNLPKIDGKVILDIDLDFFIGKDHHLCFSPSKTVRLLSARLSSVDVATVCYSTKDGFVPLEFRYLGPLLREMLTDGYSRSSFFGQLLTCSRFLAKGDTNRALRWADKCLEQRPGSAAAHYARGTVYQRMQKSMEARREISIASRLDPDYSPYYRNLLANMLNLGIKYSGKDIKKAISHSKGDLDGLDHLMLGWLYQKIGNAREAMNHCRRALAKGTKTNELYYSMGLLSIDLGEYGAAERHLLKAVEADPYCERTRFELARVFFETGRYNEAIENLWTAIGLNLAHSPSYLLLARASKKTGNDRVCRWALRQFTRHGSSKYYCEMTIGKLERLL